MDDTRVRALAQEEIRKSVPSVLVRQLQAASGGAAIRSGEVAVSAGGSVTVQHGLPRVPRSVVATTHYDGGTPAIDWVIQNVDADSFDIANPSGTTANAYWIAVG